MSDNMTTTPAFIRKEVEAMGDMADDYDGSGIGDDDIKDEYQNHIESSFEEVLHCEGVLNAAKAELQKAETIFGNAVNAAEKKLADAWIAIEMLMAETGEYEILLPGENGLDYRIGWSTPRQSVKVADVDAVPDEWCKIERKPKLKEIGAALKEGKQLNWALLQEGEKHLIWRAVKAKTIDLCKS